MTNISKRLELLEKSRPAAGPRRVIRLIAERDEGETTEAAIDRWCAEHPDEPRPSDEDLIILRSLVSPRPAA